MNDGLTEFGWDFEEMEYIEFPLAVTFEPFVGVYPIHATCYAVENGVALLEVPPKDEDRDWCSWFGEDGWVYITVPKKFVKPQ